jgi:hypothetical protein
MILPRKTNKCHRQDGLHASTGRPTIANAAQGSIAQLEDTDDLFQMARLIQGRLAMNIALPEWSGQTPFSVLW